MEKLYSRERDAVRAAKKDGHVRSDFDTYEKDGKFGWRLAVVLPPAPKEEEPSNEKLARAFNDALASTPAPEVVSNSVGRAPRFNFSQIGLPIGAVIYSTLKEGATALVESERHVTFRGSRHTLSSAAMILATEKGKSWPRIQGPLYWTYNGKKLADIREGK